MRPRGCSSHGCEVAAIAAAAAALPAPAGAARPDPPTWADEFTGSRRSTSPLGASGERRPTRRDPHPRRGRRRRRRAEHPDLHGERRPPLRDDRLARLPRRPAAGVWLLRGSREVQQRVRSMVGVLAAVADARHAARRSRGGRRRDGCRRAPRALHDRAAADPAPDVRTDDDDRGPRPARARLERLRRRDPIVRPAHRSARRPGQRHVAHVGAELDARRAHVSLRRPRDLVADQPDLTAQPVRDPQLRGVAFLRRPIPAGGYGTRETSSTNMQVDYVRAWSTPATAPRSTSPPALSGPAEVGRTLGCSGGMGGREFRRPRCSTGG